MAKKKRVAKPEKKAAKRGATKKAPAKIRHGRGRRRAPEPEAVPEKSHVTKLDPMLQLGASRAKAEARFQTRASSAGEVLGMAEKPETVSGLSLGIQSLASRMSKVGAERLRKEDPRLGRH